MKNRLWGRNFGYWKKFRNSFWECRVVENHSLGSGKSFGTTLDHVGYKFIRNHLRKIEKMMSETSFWSYFCNEKYLRNAFVSLCGNRFRAGYSGLTAGFAGISVFNNATRFPSFFFQLIWPIDTNLETIHCYIIVDHWCLWHQECITMLKWGSLIASMAQISTPKIAFAWNYTIAWIALEM